MACVLTVMCLAPFPALAWNDRGHMLAAMAAYQELKPEVRQKVDTILKAHPQHDLLSIGGPETGPDAEMWIFARACTWPDLIRKPDNPLNKTEHKSQWHYVNFPVSLEGVQGPKPAETWDGTSEPANVLQAIQKTGAEVASEKTPADRRAMSLSWSLHLISDLHQPLHAVSLFSPQFPDGDRGGNSFAVKRGDGYMNLHSYWDNLAGNSIQLDTLKTQLDGWKRDPELSRKSLLTPSTTAGAATTWAQESVQLATTVVYRNGTLKGEKHTGSRDYPKTTPELPADYEPQAKKVAAKRLMQAGYRLADELNRTLGIK